MVKNLLLQTPRGTKDILPEEQKYWQFLEDNFKELCQSFGAGRISTPVFEYRELFTSSLGDTTDIVTKQMFEVSRFDQNESDLKSDTDNDKHPLILKPEQTSPVIRAWFQHGMKTWSQPIKLFYLEPIFRYERPQAGRYRIHHQMGLEVIGDIDPLIDVSLIFLSYRFFKKLGLQNEITLDINSIGCGNCRGKMRKKLMEFFESYLVSLCPDCNKRFLKNPLRILDCKESKCRKIIDQAPALVDLLCLSCKDHFKEVLENIDNLQISYNLNPHLVRGLDYYTKTVFEFFDKSDKDRQTTLLGGGRYDDLIKSFGGESTPAIGFGAGMERIIDKIKSKEINIPQKNNIDICIAQIGDKARKMCLPLVAQLEDEGFRSTCILSKNSLKGQLSIASKLRTPICLIIGQREVFDKSVIIRDMRDSTQETVSLKNLIPFLKEKLITK